MRKTVSIIVLICLTVHGLSRLGVISYLYGNRHDLAYSLGITTEKVIALCKGDYFQDTRLTSQKDDHSLPEGLVQAQEIVLGFPPASVHDPILPLEIMAPNFVIYRFSVHFPPCSEIFHPPLC